MSKEVEQSGLRGDGKFHTIYIVADTLAEASFKTILECYNRGIRVETPKHNIGGTLGYDANILVEVRNPDAEPKVCTLGNYDTASSGIGQYILEVTHGIHNYWLKSPAHPTLWNYTYNGRAVDQLPFVFQRIKKDWDKKGRVSGRDYHFAIWRAGEDIILEQDDPPCWQTAQVRLIPNNKGELVLNYCTHWRSRDLLKAWNENNNAQVELMKLFRDKIENLLETPIQLGTYIDHSDSLHLYGSYFDKENLEMQLEQAKEKGFEWYYTTLESLFQSPYGGFSGIKRLVYAQLLACDAGHGTNLPASTLKQLGYDPDTIEYPKEWDTWPSSWDTEPNVEKLARVVKSEDLAKRTHDKNQLPLL